MSILKWMLYVLLSNIMLLSHDCYAEETYLMELRGEYSKEDAETFTDKIVGFSAEVFFSRVNTAGKPLAQAAFLDKKSSVEFGYINVESDLNNTDIEFTVGGPFVGINYITSASAFIINAFYFNGDGDSNPDRFTLHEQIFGFAIGKYINNSSAIQISFLREDGQIDDTVTFQTITVDSDIYGLEYKLVQSLSNNNFYSIDIGVGTTKKEDSSISNREENNFLSATGEYYFTRMTNLGIGIILNSGDDASQEGHTYEIGFKHFLIPYVALGIAYSKFRADDTSTEDYDSISFEIIGRM